jgi:anaerobic ribonucleoside-triphosphate reductase
VHPADDAIQIQSQDTILALITTCRTFQDVFSPFLRHKFSFNLTAVPTVKLRRKALPTGLQNTQEFEVLLEEFERNKEALETYHESQNGDYASLVVRMLKEMTNLKSFRFD